MWSGDTGFARFFTLNLQDFVFYYEPVPKPKEFYEIIL
ncbi:hypothetical protein LEP1GSC186_0573 [Leptospira noguchii serovar Autumnalis str. ZUN142]|uniref:Uncharacterized protein n=1 Tax=Leptospira noguchii serovar Autumnalis str. ZUN142 TaxID=1085540 RepID=M6U6W4_9LEPT|nr:hypothetical protein LEP1GSC186_0573 [Leptospira noguchii serovar Autumnalis str. ZUN142]